MVVTNALHLHRLLAESAAPADRQAAAAVLLIRLQRCNVPSKVRAERSMRARVYHGIYTFLAYSCNPHGEPLLQL